jgi:hypothetical protein
MYVSDNRRTVNADKSVKHVDDSPVVDWDYVPSV